MTISFTARTEDPRLDVFDPIERHKHTLRLSDAVSPSEASREAFVFPVDNAVEFTTSFVELPGAVTAIVRDESGATKCKVEPFSEQRLPEGRYTIELPIEIKTYLAVESSVEVTMEEMRTRIDFGEPTGVRLGSRSRHEQPAATITTTSDVRDVMTAVSYLGSSLKTTSPERSFPSLRGHPPLVELGDELAVPDELERPNTGVRIEVPPALEYVYPATSLAYYLGAELVPGEKPRLVTENGFEQPLDGPAGFERIVERTLKQLFFFDCVTRTEGLYDVRLHERAVVEEKVDLDFAALYDRPLAEQVAVYLSVPHDVVEPHLPDWQLTTHVDATPAQAELLPFLIDDLAIVHMASTAKAAESPAEKDAVDEFVRDGEFVRSASESNPQLPPVVNPESTASLEHAWAGDGTPLGTSKPTVRAFKNRLERDLADGNIDITVVCNDDAMSEEHDVVREAYERDDLPFDVTIRHDLTRDELRAVLTDSVEFFHYIGHIDADGFECTDGRLDASTLDSVSVDAFFLNACTSYEQGMALIEAGSIGGAVTLNDVVNSGAVMVGSAMARLLNHGFSLRSALDVASEESVIGHQYLVVGDGGLSIAQPPSGAPVLCEVESDGDEYRLALHGYPTDRCGMGALFIPHFEENDTHYLNSGKLADFTLSRDAVLDYLQLQNIPVRVDGTLTWSASLDDDAL